MVSGASGRKRSFAAFAAKRGSCASESNKSSRFRTQNFGGSVTLAGASSPRWPSHAKCGKLDQKRAPHPPTNGNNVAPGRLHSQPTHRHPRPAQAHRAHGRKKADESRGRLAGRSGNSLRRARSTTAVRWLMVEPEGRRSWPDWKRTILQRVDSERSFFGNVAGGDETLSHQRRKCSSSCA